MPFPGRRRFSSQPRDKSPSRTAECIQPPEDSLIASKQRSLRRSFKDFFRSSRDPHKPARKIVRERSSPVHADVPEKGETSAVPVLLPSSNGHIPETAAGRREQQPEASNGNARVDVDKPQQESTGSLTAEDIRKIFSGAPQFAVSTLHGRLHPHASFPSDPSIEKATDFLPLAHPAFSACTLVPHLPTQSSLYNHDHGVKEYDIAVTEMPSMLASQGADVGTVGMEYYLQLPLSDNLASEESGASQFQALDNRHLLQRNPDRLGIRSIDLLSIVERLAELGQWYREFREEAGGNRTILNKQSAAESYAILFGKFLWPPKFDASTSDPTGLKVQIEGLMTILKLEGIWRDFSLVEWRIRIGQLLWASDDLGDFDTLSEDSGSGKHVPERDILLLQTLLSAELLLRLDAVAQLDLKEVHDDLHLTTDEVRSFQGMRTKKTDWDMVLARRFLENIQVWVEQTDAEMAAPTKRGWFGSTNSSTSNEPQDNIGFLPHHQTRQLHGLFYFADAIHWPRSDDLKVKLADKLSARPDDHLEPISPSVYMTPLSSPKLTPRPVASTGDSYFSARPSLSRAGTAQQRVLQLQPGTSSSRPQSSSSEKSNFSVLRTQIGGWLSRSYLTGLILPGESIFHLLLSTLLENDPEALLILGETATLYGGFIYQGRSYWSKNCVVGRVLGALPNVDECMGWISCNRTPDGFKYGWLEIDSEPMLREDLATGKSARIAQTDEIFKDSSILAGYQIADVNPGELSIPSDPAALPDSTIWFEGLRLRRIPLAQDAVNDAGDTDAEEQAAHEASLAFSSSSLTDEHGSLSVPLKHDVQFISSFPCTLPPQSKAMMLLSSVLSDRHEGGSEDTAMGRRLLSHPLHTLHKSSTIPAKKLLSRKSAVPVDGEDEGVLVIDARGSPELELLARAWCSWQGEDSVIGRVGRTCYGCCVREARGLGVRVVIRTG